MKRFSYRVGCLGWKNIGRIGVPLKIKVSVLYDSNVGSFVLFSNDFDPYSTIVAEAKTWNELVVEVYYQIEEAIEFIYEGKHPFLLNLLPQFEQI